MHIYSRAPHRNRGGFSLAEILIVLVIIGIALAMAVPRVQQALHQSAIRGALNRVATDITLTRLRAVRTSRRAMLLVNGSGNGYTVIVDPTGTPQTFKTVSFSNDYKDLTLSPVNDSIVFDSRGMLIAGTGTIKASRQGRSDSVTVSGVGRVYRRY
ncbi:MAG TPA: GspH/FimT family protein [Longimicrobiaceae bacterium]|nr:GspH/FimT family protein [Longimicrobiaceae bacterium]